MKAPAPVQTPAPSVGVVRGATLQRKCACGQHTIAGGQCDSCREEELEKLQRSPTSASAPTFAPPIVHEVLNSPGQPLDRATRDLMEPRFGHDFSRVRVHTGAKAAESARAVNARAYTVGSDVVLGAGQDPTASSIRALMAHELTHVVQQSVSEAAPSSGLRVGTVGGPLEAEANRAAGAVTEGRGAGPSVVPGRYQQVIRRQIAQSAGEESEESEPLPAPVTLTVSLSGLAFRANPDTKFVAGPTRPQLIALAMRRLLGSRYRLGHEEEVIAQIEARARLIGGVRASGRFLPESTAKTGDPVNPFVIESVVALLFLQILKEMFHGLELMPDEEDLIVLGVASVQLYEDLRPRLPDWYTLWLFQREVADHETLLRQFREAEATPQARRPIADALLQSFIGPVNALEAIRLDTALASEKQTADVYYSLWRVPEFKTGLKAPIPIPSQVGDELLAVNFLKFIRSQPKNVEAALTQHGARVALLTQFGGFSTALSKALAGNERLRNTPGRPAITAHPATMSSFPTLQPPLFDTSVETDIRFRMSVQFADVLEAFATYSFVWERLEIPDSKMAALSKAPTEARTPESVLTQEGQTLQAAGRSLRRADPKALKGERATSGEVLRQRYRRANRYTREDIQALIDNIGVAPSIGTLTLVAANTLLRVHRNGAAAGARDLHEGALARRQRTARDVPPSRYLPGSLCGDRNPSGGLPRRPCTERRVSTSIRTRP